MFSGRGSQRLFKAGWARIATEGGGLLAGTQGPQTFWFSSGHMARLYLPATALELGGEREGRGEVWEGEEM